jgi:LysR family transcriptional regulator, regulator for metE and metH
MFNIEVRHLKLVAAIAREGAMTRAARFLNLTQSALSHQLHEIEEWLGAPLFFRLSSGMALTPAGQKFLASARFVIEEIQSTENTIRKLAVGEAGTLRLSMEGHTNFPWLTSILKLFQQEFPRINVTLVPDAISNPAQALLDGKLDLAIVHRTQRAKPLIYEPLFEDEMILIASFSHRLASRASVQLEDFEKVTFIILSCAQEDSVVRKILQPAGINPRALYHFQSIEGIVEMLEANVGVSILPRSLALPYLKAGKLRELPLLKKPFWHQWYVARIRRENSPAYIQEFLDLLIQNLASWRLRG